MIELPQREDLRLAKDMEWLIQIDIRELSQEVMGSKMTLNAELQSQIGLTGLQPGMCSDQRGVTHHLWILMQHRRIMAAESKNQITGARICAEDMMETVQLIPVSMDMVQWKKWSREARVIGSIGTQDPRGIWKEEKWKRIQVGHRGQNMDEDNQGLHTEIIQSGKTTEEQHLVLNQGNQELMIIQILLSIGIGKSHKMNSPMKTEEVRGTLLHDREVIQQIRNLILQVIMFIPIKHWGDLKEDRTVRATLLRFRGRSYCMSKFLNFILLL